MKEIFEKYSSLRQAESLKAEIGIFENVSDHDNFINLLAASVTEEKLYLLYENYPATTLSKSLWEWAALMDLEEKMFIVK